MVPSSIIFELSVSTVIFVSSRDFSIGEGVIFSCLESYLLNIQSVLKINAFYFIPLFVSDHEIRGKVSIFAFDTVHIVYSAKDHPPSSSLIQVGDQRVLEDVIRITIDLDCWGWSFLCRHFFLKHY